MYAMVPPILVMIAGWQQNLLLVAISAALLSLVGLYVLVKRIEWLYTTDRIFWRRSFWRSLTAALFLVVLILALEFTLQLGKVMGAFFVIFWGLGSIGWFFTHIAQPIGKGVNWLVSRVLGLSDDFIRPPYPVFWVLIFMLLVSMIFDTDNHHLRRLPAPAGDQYAFKNFPSAWQSFVRRPKNIVLEKKGQQVVPVFFVLSQGGGLRASYWTALVLSEFEKHFPGFHKNVFSLAGASGGSVGNVFFAAALQQAAQAKAMPYQQALLDAIGQDYLSGVTTSFLYNDMLNRFVPDSLFGPDRAAYLETDWQQGFERVFHRNGLSQGLQDFYQPYAGNTDNWMPLLISMGTLQEAGSRIITAPFASEAEVFPDQYDVYSLMGCANAGGLSCDLRLSTVGLNSARFPYITPAGTLNEADNYKNKMHILDGGYYDNFAAQTTLDMLRYLYSDKKRLQYKNKHFQPVILVISNDQALNQQGRPPYFDPLRDQPLASNSFAFNELSAPPQGLFSLYPGHTKTHIAELLAFQNKNDSFIIVEGQAPLSQTTLLNSLIIDLKDNPEVQVPLGWWLSEQVKCYMQRQTLDANQTPPACEGLPKQGTGRIYQLLGKLKKALGLAANADP